MPLIDSGYLNYYLQGRWLSIAALAVMLAGLWLIGLRSFFGPASKRLGLMAIFAAMFLSAAMVVSNPFRSPLMIAFIVFTFWRVGFERQVRSMEVRATFTAAH